MRSSRRLARLALLTATVLVAIGTTGGGRATAGTAATSGKGAAVPEPIVGQGITSSGPLTGIGISADLNCSVAYVGSASPEFFGDSACGTFVAVGGALYGPALIPAGSASPVAFTKVSQTATTGTGTAVDPFKIVTTVGLGATGIQLVQTDSYSVGAPEYRTLIEVRNSTGAAVNTIVYRAGDCYVENSDDGRGRVAGSTVGCVSEAGQIADFVPATPGSSYIEAGYSAVWLAIGTRTAFPNTCRCDELIDNGAGLSWSVSVPANGATTIDSSIKFSRAFVSLTPGRLLDTRVTGTTVDGLFQGGGPLAAGSTKEVTIAGRDGVPNDAVAAVLNLTATGARATGYITLWPCGQPMPDTSSINFRSGEDRANLAIAQLGTGGKVCVFTSASTEFLIDLSSFYSPSSTYLPVAPKRQFDSRATRPVVANSTTEVTMQNVPATAVAVVVNVTVTNATGVGYLTIWPCGSAQPTASNANFVVGSTVANLAISKVGPGGKVCVFSSAPTDLIVDLNGYYTAGPSLSALNPGRLADTRPGGATVDGVSSGAGLRTAGSTYEIIVRGRAGVATTAAAAVLNVTATGTQAAGFLTVWPCALPRPNSSNVNFASGATVPNLVLARLSSVGNVCIYTSAATHLIVDVAGSA